MNKPNFFSENNIIPAVIVAVLVLVLFAMFSGKKSDEMEADLDVNGSMRKGVFANNDWFSAEVSQINRYTARKYNIPRGTKGVVIVELDGNRDVMMKLRKGDVITAINSKKIKNLRDFRRASKDVNPTEGMFLDIQRNGYPMYVSVSGAGPPYGGQPYGFQNPHPFTMTEVTPFMGRDINLGGMNVESGIVGKQIEKWVESNFGSGFYACPKCGTLVPDNRYRNKKRISCPNCGTEMSPK